MVNGILASSPITTIFAFIAGIFLFKYKNEFKENTQDFTASLKNN